MLSDQDLVERILERDAHAFEALLARYGDVIRRHLARLVGQDAAAQDLAQETFLRVWTRAEQWDGRGSFAGWLYRIATNLAFNYLRSVGRRRELPLEGEDDEAGGEEGWILRRGRMRRSSPWKGASGSSASFKVCPKTNARSCISCTRWR